MVRQYGRVATAGALMAIGLVLALIPEPATTTLGLLLIGLGLLHLLLGWQPPRMRRSRGPPAEERPPRERR